MSKTVRDAGPASMPRVLASALDAFAEQGYHGTSIRDIAAGAGLSVPGLYHHYRSKQDVLMALMVAVMDDLLRRTTAALEAAGASSPTARFDALVEALLRFHLERRLEAFVASSEIRSLDPANRTRYVALRDEQQQMIARVVADGVAAGEFDVPHPAETVRAVATLCVGVATWYDPRGPVAADVLVERHLALARRLVGV
ncbi:TetR/AcrR family transcriptional regulator [Nocardioides sp. SYSU DS0651]|uniref:TetR/AcrR family transcriptional regulator n=1 Tax=Nocardioides sp. SYSU DS0651 TaxID=3415955 RepID=UPI003F4BA1AB